MALKPYDQLVSAQLCFLNFSNSFLTFRLKFIVLIMNDSFRIELQTARASIERHGVQPPFQLPWEKGIWKRIFNPHSSPLSTISRSLPLPSSFSTSSSSSSPLDSFPNFNSNSSQLLALDTSYGEKGATHDTTSCTTAVPSAEFWSKFFNRSDLQQGRVDGLRHLAISRFISMLAASTGSSMFLSSSDPWDLHASFSAAVSMKATSTLIKRSLDLLRFKTWCDLHDKQFLPFSECTLWQFLRELQMTAKPSGPQSILQAINFAIHVLGCHTAGPTLASVRIKGLCSGHKAMALTIKHAPPLQVDQITHLENLCCSSEDAYSKLLFGSILIAYTPDPDGKIYKELTQLNATPMTLRHSSSSCHLSTSRQHPCLQRNYTFCQLQRWYFPFLVNLGFIITFKHVVIWGYKFLESYRYPSCQQEMMPIFHMSQ